MDLAHLTNPIPSHNGVDDSDMDVSDSDDPLSPVDNGVTNHATPSQHDTDAEADADADVDADGEFVNAASDDEEDDEQTHLNHHSANALTEAHAHPDLYGLRRSVRLTH